MNCKSFNKLLPGYLYEEGSIAEREEILAHSRDCSDCMKLLDEMTGTVSLLGVKENKSFSNEEMTELRERVREEIIHPNKVSAYSLRRSVVRIFSRPLFFPLAGSLAAAAVVIMLLYNPTKVPDYTGQLQSDGANELVAMTETVEEEYDSVDELCSEMDELQLLYFEEPAPGSEAEIGSDNISISV